MTASGRTTIVACFCPRNLENVSAVKALSRKFRKSPAPSHKNYVFPSTKVSFSTISSPGAAHIHPNQNVFRITTNNLQHHRYLRLHRSNCRPRPILDASGLLPSIRRPTRSLHCPMVEMCKAKFCSLLAE